MISNNELIICHGHNVHDQEKNILKLYDKDCLTNLSDKLIPTIKEYEPLRIILKSKYKNDYFKIPELDDYYISGRSIDANDDVIYLSNTNYYLFYPHWINKELKDSFEQDVPFVPGYYSIKIFHDEKIYYSYFKIIPKDLDDDDLDDMRKEVNDKIKGFAFDFASKMKSKNRVTDNSLSSVFIDNDIDFILKNESKILFALEKIRNDSNYKINKEYYWHKNIKNDIDHITIKKLLMTSINTSFYIPRRYLDYDTDENKWLKLFINKIIKLCRNSINNLNKQKINEVNNYKKNKEFDRSIKESEFHHKEIKYKNTLSEIEYTINKLNKLKNYLQSYINKGFMKNISFINKPLISKTLMMNPSYNLLYKIYVQIYSSKNTYSLNAYYNKYWKNTAFLYEVWTYIKVLESLIFIGFNPTGGWIYDNIVNNEIQFLNDDDHVELENDYFNINVTYNQMLPKNSSGINHSTPLMNESYNRKPDIRIDVFTKKNLFLGSIILDAKYKNLPGIINGNRFGKKLRKQFIMYKDYSRSKMFKIKKSFSDRFKVVDSVLVLYPNKKNMSAISSGNNDGIYYVNVKPNQEQDELSKMLEKRFSYIKDTMDLPIWSDN